METKLSCDVMAQKNFTIGDLLEMEKKVKEIGIIFSFSKIDKEEQEPYAEQLIEDLFNGKNKGIHKSL